MNNIKLKWRIFIFFIGFCGTLLLMLWLFQTIFLNDMYKLVRKSEMNQAIEYVEKNSTSPDLQSILAKIAEEKEIFVMPTADFMIPKSDFKMQGQQKHNMMRNQEAITEQKDVILRDGSIMSLSFYAIITPVMATTRTLQMQLYFITAVMILLSSILAVILASRISKPIEKLNTSAKILATGKYDTKFSATGFLEIKELANTLNIAASELAKSEHLRRELLANVSHDLRTPLALIYSYAEVMQDFPMEITHEQTQTIMNEVNRLSILVSDILDLSKLEVGIGVVAKKSYNITKRMQEAVVNLQALVKKDGYTIKLSAKEEVVIAADEVQLTQAIYNLLINAINHTGADKVVILTQSVIGDFLKIEVSDSGEGIAADELPYIWDRYYKGAATHARATIGTGIGLSIVKKIIENHGGTYGVNSDKNGSTFWFLLAIV
ncbi:hypothetical protein AwErysi_05560 [Erysipelotrichaceae bacterium]|nr:hypothetical protein AwErysi_05560 [Erysipelotrichaceae bacterium]